MPINAAAAIGQSDASDLSTGGRAHSHEASAAAAPAPSALEVPRDTVHVSAAARMLSKLSGEDQPELQLPVKKLMEMIAPKESATQNTPEDSHGN